MPIKIDKTVVFRSLSEEHLRQILELELIAVQERVMSAAETKFVFECSATAKNVFLRDGFDVRYGARHLKRSVERLLVSPLSNLVASEQVEFGDLIYIDVDHETEKFTFARRPGAFKSEAKELIARAIHEKANATERIS